MLPVLVNAPPEFIVRLKLGVMLPPVVSVFVSLVCPTINVPAVICPSTPDVTLRSPPVVPEAPTMTA